MRIRWVEVVSFAHIRFGLNLLKATAGPISIVILVLLFRLMVIIHNFAFERL